MFRLIEDHANNDDKAKLRDHRIHLACKLNIISELSQLIDEGVHLPQETFETLLNNMLNPVFYKYGQFLSETL